MSQPPFPLPGGIHPDGHKAESNGTPIRPAPLPPRLILPLRQHSGSATQPCVAVGAQVHKGECLARPGKGISATLHAPTSGRVRAIAAHRLPHPSGLNGLCIEIEPDGAERWIERTPPGAGADPTVQRASLAASGLVGLGGAAFPTQAKIEGGSGRISTLLINGAECEPWITCDDRLMRERSAGIAAGIALLQRLLDARRVLVGIEDDKPEAIAAMQAACSGRGFDIVPLPARYPSGGERQLARLLTGAEIPTHQRPARYGLQIYNVGTAWSLHRWLEYGEPLLSRIVTLTGHVARPGNVELLLGTPLDSALDCAGGVLPGADGCIFGGPLMGFRLPLTPVPLVKGSNCVLVTSPQIFPAPPPEWPCIRCGRCAEACPVELQPQQLLADIRAGAPERAEAHRMADCIECGACAYVCPSAIPLVQYYRAAKGELRARARARESAERARRRNTQRQARLALEQAEKAARLAARRGTGPGTAGDPP